MGSAHQSFSQGKAHHQQGSPHHETRLYFYYLMAVCLKWNDLRPEADRGAVALGRALPMESSPEALADPE